MSPRAKVFLQYTVILAATVALIWFSLQGLHVEDGENKWDYLSKTWYQADKGWLLVMALVSMISHLVRAERWRMLLTAVDQNTTLNRSFLSLMVGYLVNLVIPRGGEVSRCYNLYKLDKIPVDVIFGTVVLERIIDLLCLIILIALSFLLESKKLFAFIETLPINASAGSSKVVLILSLGGIGLAVLGIAYWLFRKNEKLRSFVLKTWNGFKGGLLSIFKLKKKSLFIFYSLMIWMLYFAMSYAVVKAFPSTSELGFQAVVSLFAIGAIAMAAPLPGGAGSYHVLVPQGLVFLYSIPQSDAVAFTFIFHGWQTLILIVAGAVSLIITSFLVKKNPGLD